jgi:UDP-3-O-acyl-N-acetylglucosamine deacetylase
VFRVADEPARHKILDLLGDLCFAKPALPKVRLEIINGGHLSHRTILEKVLPYALQ